MGTSTNPRLLGGHRGRPAGRALIRAQGTSTVEIEAMRDQTTEHTPNSLEATDRATAEIVSYTVEMLGDASMQEGAIEAIRGEIAEAEREAAAGHRACGLRVARAYARHPIGGAAGRVD